MPSPLKENEFGITIILIAHNNSDRLRTRLDRDILPTIKAHPHWKFQLICIDNSDADKRFFFNLAEEENVEFTSIFPGANIMYGPAMNMAIAQTKYPYLVYICSNHGRMYDVTWIDDLVTPIIQNSNIAMSGTLYPSGNPVDMGFPLHLPPVHVQGGVFAASKEVLLAYPYTADDRWKHWGSDIYQCFQLVCAGYTLQHVETVNSVWRQAVINPEQWKYVHDYSE